MQPINLQPLVLDLQLDLEHDPYEGESTNNQKFQAYLWNNGILQSAYFEYAFPIQGLVVQFAITQFCYEGNDSTGKYFPNPDPKSIKVVDLGGRTDKEKFEDSTVWTTEWKVRVKIFQKIGLQQAHLLDPLPNSLGMLNRNQMGGEMRGIWKVNWTEYSLTGQNTAITHDLFQGVLDTIESKTFKGLPDLVDDQSPQLLAV